MNPLAFLRRFTYISAGDLFTLANGILGLLALTYILDNTRAGFGIAAGLLLLAVVADGLDGEVARRFGTKHHYGIYLDSIADTVSFCLAPAALIYMLFYDPGRGPALDLLNGELGWEPRFDAHNSVALTTALLVGVMGMLRLARFSLRKEDGLSYFGGLPTPAMNLLILPVVFLASPSPILEHGSGARGEPFLVGNASATVLLLLAGATLLMVTELPYPKPRGRFAVAALISMVLAGVAVVFHLQGFEHVYVVWGAVLSLQVAYVVTGPLITLHYLRRVTLPPEQELIPYGYLTDTDEASGPGPEAQPPDTESSK